MREFRSLAIDTIHESPTNPRRVFDESQLDELAASIRLHGVIQPIVVTRNGDGFIVRAGARRLRASRRAGLSDIPCRILDADGPKAEEIALVENIQRKDLEALDEAYAYRRFLDQGRTLDELAATVQKPKRHVHECLRLLDLIPEAQDLLARGILPIDYALPLARVPAERQADGLAQCFRPLFGEEGPQRDQLEPRRNLTTWIEKTVRLDPRGSDTRVLLPELADHVKAIDEEKGASILMLSTLHNHTPSDRDGAEKEKPILARSWVAVDGADTCKYARPGVIVLGPGQGDQLQVCIEKKRCTKHWVRQEAETTTAGSSADQTAVDEARRAQAEKEAKRREAEERWENELRPRALKLIATRTAKLRWTPELLELVLARLTSGAQLEEFVSTKKLPAARYPQALAVALAVRVSWRRESLFELVKALGIRVSVKELARDDNANDDHPSQASEKRKSVRRPSKGKKAPLH
jgi:ParB family chromosome partitioning protein